MGLKVEFIPTTRIVQVTEAPDASGSVTIDVRTDIYSDGKEDWQLTGTLTGMKFPVRVVGGEPITEQTSLGATFFLEYGWKIRPYEASHTFFLEGNIYSSDGTPPVVDTTGSYNVRTLNARSSLIDQVASANDIADAVWTADLDEYRDDIGSMGLKVIRISNDTIFTK